jgi:hypothetical protein
MAMSLGVKDALEITYLATWVGIYFYTDGGEHSSHAELINHVRQKTSH